MDDDEAAQGWYVDPCGIHEHRWMSSGRPTSLVRDGAKESTDEPPDEPPSHPFVPVAAVATRWDARRADDATRQAIPGSASYGDAAFDGNVVFNNPNPAAGPSPLSTTGFETSFEHKMRKRARKQRRAERRERWFGKPGASDS